MDRIDYLREQTLSGKNKCKRTPFVYSTVENEEGGLCVRKALALCRLFEEMPIYIGKGELIVGTRTIFPANKGNEDGHDVFGYGLSTKIGYVNDKERELFGADHSYRNKTHYTPDLSIVLDKGIGGIISEAEGRLCDTTLSEYGRDFLLSVVIAYKGLRSLILRYSDEALRLADNASEGEKAELYEISRICKRISTEPPKDFREAVQLLWLTHLGTIIESFEFINYGRLDVILQKFLKDTRRDEALETVACLLLKMYDQADLVTTYLGSYAAQLVVTLGGVLPSGENAANEVTMLFLDALDRTRLPEPEFNLRISSKNPPEFLERAASLTVSGCNNVSYYNDDLFVANLCGAGIREEYARDYGFDLCQDINIPGRGDFYRIGSAPLAELLLALLRKKTDFTDFDSFLDEYKRAVSLRIKNDIDSYNEGERQLKLYADGCYDEYFDNVKIHKKPIGCSGRSPMAPLPLLSALYHGCIENALDINLDPLPIREKGYMLGTATEAVNSLAAIKKVVYDDRSCTLDEVFTACETNFEGERGTFLRALLWKAPKWGNDDDYVDSIARDVLDFALRECEGYVTYRGGRVLGGIHQPHPVSTGKKLMATPEGRYAFAPVAVTLTPESGTMKNGATAALASAAKLDPSLNHWNCCVMVNYFASVFKGNGGRDIFISLLRGYFNSGGLQHQPNVSDVDELRRAQLSPEKYKDLIVRLWGVSAHFVDLPRELQDEMIARFS